MKEKYCQMTIIWGTYGKDSTYLTYGKCSRTAKFRVPHPKMGVEYVCGIHARSLNKTFERIGDKTRCVPL